jgi:hypothetical protein
MDVLTKEYQEIMAQDVEQIKTPLELTSDILGHIVGCGKAEDSDPLGNYSKAYSEAFTLVAAAQSLVRHEQEYNRVVGAYKAL